MISSPAATEASAEVCLVGTHTKALMAKARHSRISIQDSWGFEVAGWILRSSRGNNFAAFQFSTHEQLRRFHPQSNCSHVFAFWDRLGSSPRF